MILNEILSNIDSNWSIKEKVRYIYWKMCLLIKYDDRFSYSKNPKLLESIYYKPVSIDEDIDSEVVCNTANILFSQLMNRLGINNKLIYKESKIERKIDAKDVACLFYDEQGNSYYTNIIGDIENCKFGLKTAFFGISKNEYDEAQEVDSISAEELYEIDKKLGLIKKDYNDIVFELLRNEVKNTCNFKNFLRKQNIEVEGLSSEKILEYKMKFLNTYIKFRDKSAGTFEIKKFYKFLFNSSVLNRLEKDNFYTFEYIRENGEDIDITFLICINLQTNPTYFYFSDENESYVAIKKEELQDMLKGYRSRFENKDILNINYSMSNENSDYIIE